MLPMFGRRPLTRLELGLYAVIIAIVLVVFLERLLATMELAERSAMEQTVSRVNSALNLRIAYDMLNGKRIDIPAALKKNPFTLANLAQPNFRGAGDTADLPTLDGGTWFFDQDRLELVYKPRLKRNLEIPDGSGVLRFKLVPAPGTRYTLVPANKFEWR